ncbi:chemotaxis protein CheW [Guyparkeria halophila]|uniref:Chemotaxis protein CheW n=1 Tax=Guyparkeria halophila TaxID=47960 RepID=A0ABZ0YXR7_9GAMM|nr:chemotaxis protein CheW [Guyparkeria halophila]WQH16966.1 chemotaxis protein CheW [Guyparkeria halophila]
MMNQAMEKTRTPEEYDEELEAQDQGPLSRWVNFTVDEETYALNVLDVQEVLRDAEITPIPGAPDAIMGIINLRGNVVTVVDARTFFGLEEKPWDENSRIMVIEVASGEIVGLVVDSVAEVIALPQTVVDQAMMAVADDRARHILGIVPQDEKLIILVDMKSLSDISAT